MQETVDPPDQEDNKTLHIDAETQLAERKCDAWLQILLVLYPVVFKQASINGRMEILNLIAMDLKSLAFGLDGFNWD